MNDDVTRFKVTLFEYNVEANALMRADYNDLVSATERFLAYIEGERQIKEFLSLCIADHPDFDAKQEVEQVKKDMGTSFGPFPASYKDEVAEVYQILKEMLAQNCFDSYQTIYPYGHGSNKFNDMAKGFLDKVAYRLVSGIGRYLTTKGLEMGLSETPQQNNYFSNNGPAAASMSQGKSQVTINQQSGINTEELDRLIETVLASCSEISAEQSEQVDGLLTAIREQALSQSPKRGVLTALTKALKGINGSVQFASAVATLATFINTMPAA